MGRLTITDLAAASEVSVSTVNRILAGSARVKPATIQRVRETAERIGFYGLGVIEARRQEAIPRYRLGFLLQQSTRDLYQLIGAKIREAVGQRREEQITADIEFVDDLEPENIAIRLKQLGERCDAVALIAGDHPLISQAIQALKADEVPVVTYITDQSAPNRAGYVGTDNWKLGRTAAWLITKTADRAGRVAVFIGNHRYQCQDIADASFRSYMREHSDAFVIDDSRLTHEDAEEAFRMVSSLLEEADDLVGIFITGGGISGVLRALRQAPEERRRRVRVVCRDIGPETRKGLVEHLITAALIHPLEITSAQLVQTMLDAIRHAGDDVIVQRTIPFQIVTPENV